MKFIDAGMLKAMAKELGKTDYAEYLLTTANEK